MTDCLYPSSMDISKVGKSRPLENVLKDNSNVKDKFIAPSATRAPGSPHGSLPQPYYEIRRIESNPRSISITLLDEDLPLTDEEKRIFYTNSKYVLSSRQIRQLMNAHIRAKLNSRFNASSTKRDRKMEKIIFGLALLVQIGMFLIILL